MIDTRHEGNVWRLAYDNEIDALWTNEAEKRALEVRAGKVKTVPGDRVFNNTRDRYFVY